MVFVFSLLRSIFYILHMSILNIYIFFPTWNTSILFSSHNMFYQGSVSLGAEF